MVIGLRRAVLACFVLAAAAAGCHRKVTEAHFSLENGLRVGAVGVSGLPGEVDEQLAVAAIRAAGLEPPSVTA